MKAALPDSPLPPRLLIVGNPWLGTSSSIQSGWQLFGASLCCSVWDQLLLAALTCPLKMDSRPGWARWNWVPLGKLDGIRP